MGKQTTCGRQMVIRGGLKGAQLKYIINTCLLCLLYSWPSTIDRLPLHSIENVAGDRAFWSTCSSTMHSESDSFLSKSISFPASDVQNRSLFRKSFTFEDKTTSTYVMSRHRLKAVAHSWSDLRLQSDVLADNCVSKTRGFAKCSTIN